MLNLFEDDRNKIHNLFHYKYSWVPLVPETNGHIDQYDLNAFSMAMLWRLVFLVKNPLHLVFGLNKYLVSISG